MRKIALSARQNRAVIRLFLRITRHRGAVIHPTQRLYTPVVRTISLGNACPRDRRKTRRVPSAKALGGQPLRSGARGGHRVELARMYRGAADKGDRAGVGRVHFGLGLHTAEVALFRGAGNGICRKKPAVTSPRRKRSREVTMKKGATIKKPWKRLASKAESREIGGAWGDRTPDLVIANDALSQLS